MQFWHVIIITNLIHMPQISRQPILTGCHLLGPFNPSPKMYIWESASETGSNVILICIRLIQMCVAKRTCWLQLYVTNCWQKSSAYKLHGKWMTWPQVLQCLFHLFPDFATSQLQWEVANCKLFVASWSNHVDIRAGIHTSKGNEISDLIQRRSSHAISRQCKRFKSFVE